MFELETSTLPRDHRGRHIYDTLMLIKYENKMYDNIL